MAARPVYFQMIARPESQGEAHTLLVLYADARIAGSSEPLYFGDMEILAAGNPK